MRKSRRVALGGAAIRTARRARRPGSPKLGERIAALPRLTRAVLRGDYQALSRSRLAMMAVAAAYIVSPVDALPEFLPIIGVMDDAGVALWLFRSFFTETDKYLDNERATRAGA